MISRLPRCANRPPWHGMASNAETNTWLTRFLLVLKKSGTDSFMFQAEWDIEKL
jgi:hypothetical protein